MRVAVVGHCEWVDFVRVERLPLAGEIVRGEAMLGVPGGSGAVAAKVYAGSPPIVTATGIFSPRS